MKKNQNILWLSNPIKPIKPWSPHYRLKFDYRLVGPIDLCFVLFFLLCLSGFYLAVGFVSGIVKVLDPCTLEEEGEESFKYSHDCITHLAFSHNSLYLAAAVSAHATIKIRFKSN